MKDSQYDGFVYRGIWPPWIDENGNVSLFAFFTKKYLEEEFRKHGLRHNPVDIIVSTFLISKALSNQPIDIWERVEDEFCYVIFGSNLIEDVGAGFDYTVSLCGRVFRGEHVDITDTDRAELLYDSEQGNQEINRAAASRVRREIVQHARALLWAINNIVIAGMPWSEDVIKTIHGILYTGIVNDVIVPGEYRGVDHPITAEYIDRETGEERITRFIHPHVIPSRMAAWVRNLNTDISSAESGSFFDGSFVDPYDLAAEHYRSFIDIHPFGVGNGLVSRIILNCLVMRFTGHMIPMGMDDEEKREFLGIAIGGAEKPQDHSEIAKLMARKSVEPLTRMWTWIKKHPQDLHPVFRSRLLN
ncbi:fido domain-containing protein [Xylaria curta]|nr:fido domain-containing protein [Xylaria curta]